MFYRIKEKVRNLIKKEKSEVQKKAEKIELQEYRLKAEGPDNILKKVVIPGALGNKLKSKTALLDRLCESILNVLPKDDLDNLIILNLDDYFDKVEKKSDFFAFQK